jgi:hypothetical protein
LTGRTLRRADVWRKKDEDEEEDKEEGKGKIKQFRWL